MKRILTSLLALLLAGTAHAGRRPSAEKNLTIDINRAVPVLGTISPDMSLPIASTISALAAKSKDPVWLVISSPGGSVLAMGHILEAMEMAKRDGVKINCLVAQMAMSAAFHIFTHCDQRYTLRSAVLLWHPVKVAFLFAYFTAADLAYISERLVLTEEELTEDALSLLPIDEDMYMYHYVHETLWSATDLQRELPGWFTIVDSVRGVPVFFPLKPAGEGDGKKQSTPNRQPAPFEFVW